MPKDASCENQRGSAIILVLLSIGLFAALAFTFMRGSEQGQGNLTAAQTKITAQEIIHYGKTLSQAVDKLRSKGCSENQLNFKHPSLDAGHNNTSAPSDGSCDIFHENGGKIQRPLLSTDLFKAPSNYNHFAAGVNFPGTPTTSNDLYWIFEFPSTINREQLCQEINRILDVTNDPVSNINTVPFSGTIPGSSGANASLNGLSAACFNYIADTKRKFYYQILLER